MTKEGRRDSNVTHLEGEYHQKQSSKGVTAYNQVFYPEGKALLRRSYRDNESAGAFSLPILEMNGAGDTDPISSATHSLYSPYIPTAMRRSLPVPFNLYSVPCPL